MEEQILVESYDAEIYELLISIDEKLDLVQNISTSLIWIFVALLFLAGLNLISLFFVGKGDKG